MKITKIILNKYRRLFLNNIERLEYNPELPIQVIIGRNMCGKSSLLKELTPLPAEVKKEFKDGGYKEIHIEHNGSNYILTSKIDNGKVTHSFLKDNEELNDGRNKKIQLELVKTYFNLSPDIVDVLLNKKRFTNMSPFERKHWFSEMSSIDYSYPISVYTKIKTRHRDIVGGMKLSVDNISATETKLENNNLIDKYLKDKEILEQVKDHINSLYVLDNDFSLSLEEVHNSFNIDISNLEKLLSNPIDTKLTKEEVKSSIETDKVKLNYIKNQIEETHKELDLLESTNKYKYKDKNEIETNEYIPISNKLNSLENDCLSSLHQDVKSLINFDLLTTDYLAFGNILPDVIGNVNELSQYDYLKNFSIDDMKKLKETINNLKEDIKKKEVKITFLNNEKESLSIAFNKQPRVICPKCDNDFVATFDNKILDKSKQEMEDLEKSRDELIKQLEKHTSLEERLLKRNELLNNIKNIMRNNSNLKYIWVSLLSSKDINTISSEELLTLFNSYYIKMSSWKDITMLREQLKEIKKKMDLLEEIKKMNVSLEESRIEVLNKKIYELQSSSKLISDNITKYEKYYKILDSISNAYYSLSKGIKNYKDNLNKLTIVLRNKYLMELSNKIKDDINVISNEIANFKSGKDLINNEKKKLEEYKVKEKVLKILEKELSPSEGLIAKSINSFLNIFVEEMNEVISNIWTYDIQLLPCDIDSENGYDLDYKFRVKVDNNEIIEDVSKLSSSGQEIVDLAYRLVFSKYMGLDEIPLMLDEFGSSFDKSHRTKAYEVIDRILGSEYGQIFLICHFESLYGTLRNMDVNILDPNNIELGYVTEKNSKFKIN